MYNGRICYEQSGVSLLRRPIWRTGILAIASVVIALVLGEIVVRVATGDKYGPRPTFYGPSDELGWVPTPRLNNTFYGPDFSIHVETDENGYRLGALGEVDFSKRLILLCGDSYVFGWGVSSGETFASFLDSKVSGETQGRMRVVNLGVGGYGTWQNAFRLKEFMDKYPNASVAAVIVVHCQNDVIDNFKSLGYQLGIWKAVEKPAKRSRSHLANLIRFAVENVKQRGQQRRLDDLGAVVNDPFMQDVLWSAKLANDFELPVTFAVGTDTVNLSGVTSERDINERRLAKAKELTDPQREVEYLGNKLIHGHAKKLGCPVYHTYTYTTADWYIDEVDRQIKRSANKNVFGVGRFPPWGSFKGRFLNDHSGKHFNIEFNRFWADRMFRLLEDQGVLG
jgi:hypothetical protein